MKNAAIGTKAWVRKAGGQNLNLRDNPGLQSAVIDTLTPGTQVTLLAVPSESDNYSWWYVHVEDGRKGWVAGEELVDQPE